MNPAADPTLDGKQWCLIPCARRLNIAATSLHEAPCAALRMNLSAFDRYLARRHFPSLDGLRCLSIVPVVWHHCTPRPLSGVMGKGPIGVDGRSVSFMVASCLCIPAEHLADDGQQLRCRREIPVGFHHSQVPQIYRKMR